MVKSIINNIQTYLLSTTEIKKHTYRVLQLVIRAYVFLKTNLIEAIIEFALPNIINRGFTEIGYVPISRVIFKFNR